MVSVIAGWLRVYITTAVTAQWLLVVMSLLSQRKCEILSEVSLFIRQLNVYNIACSKLINYSVGK